MEYTLGFIFDPAMRRVVLIEKERPLWQKGKLNGVGGKVEPGETIVACMVREAFEECGVPSIESDWMQVAILSGTDWRMNVFGSISAQEILTASASEGIVRWHAVDAIPPHALSNIPWLVQMAKDKLMNRTFNEVAVLYP